MDVSKLEFEEVRKRVNGRLLYSLIGCITKKTRGITADYKDGYLWLEMYFDSNLTEEEEEEMDIAYTEFVSEFTHYEFKNMYIKMKVINVSSQIKDKAGNLGWFYLRHEY